MAARMSFLAGLLALCLVACDATEPVSADDPRATAEESSMPAADTLTKQNPVAFVEIEGPTFFVVYNPNIISSDGALFHSQKNCPDSPPNYAFPLSEPVQASDGLRRMTMACQYKFN